MMLERLRVGIVIVLVSFDVKKGESRAAVAHGEVIASAGRKFLDPGLF